MFFSIIIFGAVIYVLAKDLDYFIYRKSAVGTYKILSEKNNKIELKISYQDDYKDKYVYNEKKIKNSYRSVLNEIDSNKVDISYSRWFDQTYINNIKKPKIGILVIEGFMLLVMGFSIKTNWDRLFSSKKNH